MTERSISHWHKLGSFAVTTLVCAAIFWVMVTHKFSSGPYTDFWLVPLLVAAGLTVINPFEMDDKKRPLVFDHWLIETGVRFFLAFAQTSAYGAALWLATHDHYHGWATLQFAVGALIMAASIALGLTDQTLNMVISAGLLFWGVIGLVAGQGEIHRLSLYGLILGLCCASAAGLFWWRRLRRVKRLASQVRDTPGLQDGKLTLDQTAQALGISRDLARLVLKRVAKTEPHSRYDNLYEVLRRSGEATSV
jgi:hypothetical protein